ncbi:hypothetical protein AMS68_002501 [Peltaster fructicola]|uniref:Large ribosomal subunit protein uL3m n=1 Tax=Peltaster fructicola TaxID=286661 RepID=A0A6H0XQH8_9PEZI|nr:hypothetical protein AMS68_002501 [Peltaster fructicola]
MPLKGPSPLFVLPPRFLCPNVSRTFLREIHSIDNKKPSMNNRYNNMNGNLLGASQQAAFLRKENIIPRRSGALVIKQGMTGIYDPVTARRQACTVLQLDRCQVVSHKTMRKHGYWAVQIGSGTTESRNVSRPMRGHFAAQEVPISRDLAEFRVRNEAGLIPVGTVITADLFHEGQCVDVRAITKGKGFAGGMKRHGFSGQPASHGTSLTHRAMGSAGASQGSGSRVLPGKRMAGRMGGERHTIQNLKVMKVDKENGIVVVSGPVPGPKKSIVHIQDALKKPWAEAPTFPAPEVAAT